MTSDALAGSPLDAFEEIDDDIRFIDPCLNSEAEASSGIATNQPQLPHELDELLTSFVDVLYGAEGCQPAAARSASLVVMPPCPC